MSHHFKMLYIYGNFMADIRIFKIFNCQNWPSISLCDLDLRAWKMGMHATCHFISTTLVSRYIKINQKVAMLWLRQKFSERHPDTHIEKQLDFYMPPSSNRGILTNIWIHRKYTEYNIKNFHKYNLLFIVYIKWNLLMNKCMK